MRDVLVAIFTAVLFGVVVNGVYTNVKLRRHGGRVTAQVVSVRTHRSTGTDENGTRTRITTYKAVLSLAAIPGPRRSRNVQSRRGKHSGGLR
jgi:hypothetical protein